MRWRTLATVMLVLPALPSAVMVISTPPLVAHMPPALVTALDPIATQLYLLVGHIPPQSVEGRLFFGSYYPLVPIFGQGALAAHAALLASPWVLGAIIVVTWPAGHRRWQTKHPLRLARPTTIAAARGGR
ncbi:MAG: hypothetical protein ACYDDF_05475 [Thermoplasmatota archaeon]